MGRSGIIVNMILNHTLSSELSPSEEEEEEEDDDDEEEESSSLEVDLLLGWEFRCFACSFAHSSFEALSS